MSAERATRIAPASNASPLAHAPRPWAAILQSNYLYWRGHLDMIALVDTFVLFDDVQFTKRDWRSRNRIKAAEGPVWLTVPVVTKGRRDQTIDQVEIADPSWAENHWTRIRHAYAKAPYFAHYGPAVQAMYEAAARETRLSAVNRLVLTTMMGFLGITTTLVDARSLAARGEKTARLVDLCTKLGARGYVNGPAGQAYMEPDLFSRAGITLAYMDYAGYPDYPQLHGPFEPQVAAIDLIFNTGPDAPQYMKFAARPGALTKSAP